MLSVGYSATEDILKEDLEDTTGLFVDKTTREIFLWHLAPPFPSPFAPNPLPLMLKSVIELWLAPEDYLSTKSTKLLGARFFPILESFPTIKHPGAMYTHSFSFILSSTTKQIRVRLYMV